MSNQLNLFDAHDPVPVQPGPARTTISGAATPLEETAALPDQPARDYAVDPVHNVVLEASAGTGKRIAA